LEKKSILQSFNLSSVSWFEWWLQDELFKFLSPLLKPLLALPFRHYAFPAELPGLFLV